MRLVKALALSSAPWNASLMLSSVCVMFVSFLNSIEKRTITLPFLAEKKNQLQIQNVAIVFNIYLIMKNIRLKSLIYMFIFFIFILLLEVIDVGTVKIASNWAVLEK